MCVFCENEILNKIVVEWLESFICFVLLPIYYLVHIYSKWPQKKKKKKKKRAKRNQQKFPAAQTVVLATLKKFKNIIIIIVFILLSGRYN